MTEAESPLPAGWVDVLDEIHRRLDQSIAEADARIREMPTFDLQPIVAMRSSEIAQWSDRLKRLSAFMETSEVGVRAVAESLEIEETRVREDIDLCSRLQRRLADCTRGAIG